MELPPPDSLGWLCLDDEMRGRYPPALFIQLLWLVIMQSDWSIWWRGGCWNTSCADVNLIMVFIQPCTCIPGAPCYVPFVLFANLLQSTSKSGHNDKKYTRFAAAWLWNYNEFRDNSWYGGLWKGRSILRPRMKLTTASAWMLWISGRFLSYRYLDTDFTKSVGHMTNHMTHWMITWPITRHTGWSHGSDIPQPTSLKGGSLLITGVYHSLSTSLTPLIRPDNARKDLSPSCCPLTPVGPCRVHLSASNKFHMQWIKLLYPETWVMFIGLSNNLCISDWLHIQEPSSAGVRVIHTFSYPVSTVVLI